LTVLTVSLFDITLCDLTPMLNMHSSVILTYDMSLLLAVWKSVEPNRYAGSVFAISKMFQYLSSSYDVHAVQLHVCNKSQ